MNIVCPTKITRYTVVTTFIPVLICNVTHLPPVHLPSSSALLLRQTTVYHSKGLPLLWLSKQVHIVPLAVCTVLHVYWRLCHGVLNYITRTPLNRVTVVHVHVHVHCTSCFSRRQMHSFLLVHVHVHEIQCIHASTRANVCTCSHISTTAFHSNFLYSRYIYCPKCFSEIQGDTVTVGDDPLSATRIPKSQFKELKNNAIDREP